MVTVQNPHLEAANISKYNHNHSYGDYHLTQATLALAYEQQTANLIAWVSSGKSYIKHQVELTDEINKRLGLYE